jgi:hypothetical protein
VPTLPPVSSPVVLPKKLIKTIEFYSDSTFAEKAAP